MEITKVRIRFRKADDLRFLSHHDLMRLWERLLRRAALPFRSSEGFHPMPKLAFPSALGLGIAGLNEVAELELDGECDPEEVGARLAAHAPPGLDVLGVKVIDRKRSGQACRACYRLPLPGPRDPALAGRAAALLAEPALWVERAKPQLRKVNIRPFLRAVEVRDEGLILDMIVTPQGTARPDEVLALLGLADAVNDGAVLERTVVEIEDEVISSQQSAVSRQPNEEPKGGSPADG